MAYFRANALSAGLCAVLLLAFPRRALAYLDPGTGSYLIQVLLAGLLAIALTVRLFWRNIRAFFKGQGWRGRKAPEGKPDEN